MGERRVESVKERIEERKEENERKGKERNEFCAKKKEQHRSVYLHEERVWLVHVEGGSRRCDDDEGKGISNSASARFLPTVTPLCFFGV